MTTTVLFRPMVMLVGQYSTGKTTFIRYLLEQDFPGIRIGPEPTTDRYRTWCCNGLPRQGWVRFFNRPPRILIGPQLFVVKNGTGTGAPRNKAVPTGCSLPVVKIIRLQVPWQFSAIRIGSETAFVRKDVGVILYSYRAYRIRRDA
jgi:hypothetical protein